MQSCRIVKFGVSDVTSYERFQAFYSHRTIDINEYLPKETLAWCHSVLLSYGVDRSDIRMGDVNGNGDRLHVDAYHALRYAIHTHMASGQLPILMEAEKPTGGYEGAIARDGVLKQVIMANMEYIANIRSGRIPSQLLTFQEMAPDWQFLGDPPDDLGWANEPVAE
jgi:hypothetical protein